MDAVPAALDEAWTAAEPGRWDSADGRFSITRVGESDWRLTEIVPVARLPAGVVLAAMEFDRAFSSPRQAMCYAVRLARQLARGSGERSDGIIGRGGPRGPRGPRRNSRPAGRTAGEPGTERA